MCHLQESYKQAALLGVLEGTFKMNLPRVCLLVLFCFSLVTSSVILGEYFSCWSKGEQLEVCLEQPTSHTCPIHLLDFPLFCSSAPAGWCPPSDVLCNFSAALNTVCFRRSLERKLVSSLGACMRLFSDVQTLSHTEKKLSWIVHPQTWSKKDRETPLLGLL